MAGRNGGGSRSIPAMAERPSGGRREVRGRPRGDARGSRPAGIAARTRFAPSAGAVGGLAARRRGRLRRNRGGRARRARGRGGGRPGAGRATRRGRSRLVGDTGLEAPWLAIEPVEPVVERALPEALRGDAVTLPLGDISGDEALAARIEAATDVEVRLAGKTSGGAPLRGFAKALGDGWTPAAGIWSGPCPGCSMRGPPRAATGGATRRAVLSWSDARP